MQYTQLLLIIVVLVLHTASERTWSDWRNNDGVWGVGDFENADQWGCGAFELEAIECREAVTHRPWYETDNILLPEYNCTTTGGYQCRTILQVNQTLCADVEVRVKCRNHLACTNKNPCTCQLGYEWNVEFETCTRTGVSTCPAGTYPVRDDCCPVGTFKNIEDYVTGCVEPDSCLTWCGDSLRNCNSIFMNSTNRTIFTCEDCPANYLLDAKTKECVCEEGYTGEGCLELELQENNVLVTEDVVIDTGSSFEGDLTVTGSNIIISGSLQIGRDFILNNSTLIFSSASPITVHGTTSFNGKTTIQSNFTLEYKKSVLGEEQVLIISDKFEGLDMILNQPSPCIDGVSERYTHSKTNLSVIFESCGINITTILIIIVVSALSVLTVLLMILFIRPIRKFVLPYRDRKKSNDAVKN